MPRDWIPLYSGRILASPKWNALTMEERGAWMAALCYAATTDGEFTHGQLATLLRKEGAKDPARLIARLVSIRLVDETPDGHAIHDWADWQRPYRGPSDMPEAVAERQRNKRRRDAQVSTRDVTTDIRDTTTDKKRVEQTRTDQKEQTAPAPDDAYDVMLLVENLTRRPFNYREGHNVHDTLVGDVAAHGASKMSDAYRSWHQRQGGPVDAAQLVFGVHNDLHPLVKSKPMTEQERKDAEIAATIREWNKGAAA